MKKWKLRSHPIRDAESRLLILILFPYIQDTILFYILKVINKITFLSLRSSIKRLKDTKMYNLRIYDKRSKVEIVSVLHTRRYKVYSKGLKELLIYMIRTDGNT